MHLQSFSASFLLHTSYRKNSSSDLAERSPKSPFINGLRSPQGQRHQQQDICHTQVEDEGICHTPALPALNQNSQQHSVPQDTNNKCH